MIMQRLIIPTATYMMNITATNTDPATPRLNRTGMPITTAHWFTLIRIGRICITGMGISNFAVMADVAS